MPNFWPSKIIQDSIDNITTNISYSSGDQAKSFSIWVKFKNQNDRGWVIGNNVGCQPGTTSAGFGLFTTNSELWFHGDGFVADIPNVLTFDTTKFYNVVATHEFSTTKIFVNGVFVSSENNQLNTSNGTFLIGSRVDSPIDPNCLEEWFEGIVDDIAIYNRALSQQEITALYQGANTTTNCPTFPASLTQGLVGYWPFCGNALDESGNNNHGTVNGATLTTDRFGNQGSAYGFDGVSNFIQLQNSSSIDSLVDFSVGAWVKANSTTPQFQMIVSKDTSGDPPKGDWDLYLNNDKFKFAIVKNTVAYEAPSNFSIVNNNWNYISMVRNGANGKVTIFVNGKIDTVFFGYSGLQKNKQKMIFGKQGSSNLHFLNGSLDDIAIWNRALSQNEIAQLYNQGICQTSITVTDTLLIHTGITSYNPMAYGNTLKIWPNPGNQDITLDAGNLSLMQGWKIKISNSLGQEVYPAALISQQQQVLDMSAWGGNGLYLLHLINPQGHITEVKKIVLAP